MVASAVGGLPDIVREGETGLLVPPGDTGALRTALTRLLQAPDWQATMAKTCRQMALAEFSFGLQSRRYVSLYEDLLQSSQKDKKLFA